MDSFCVARMPTIVGRRRGGSQRGGGTIQIGEHCKLCPAGCQAHDERGWRVMREDCTPTASGVRVDNPPLIPMPIGANLRHGTWKHDGRTCSESGMEGRVLKRQRSKFWCIACHVPGAEYRESSALTEKSVAVRSKVSVASGQGEMSSLPGAQRQTDDIDASADVTFKAIRARAGFRLRALCHNTR